MEGELYAVWIGSLEGLESLIELKLIRLKLLTRP